MERIAVAFGGFLYTLALILAATALVMYSPVIHASFLGTEAQIETDAAITSFLLTQNLADLPAMTEEEVSHMQDVAWLVTTLMYLLAGLIAVLTFLFLHAHKEERIAMLLSPALFFILFQTAGIKFFENFSVAFEQFHQVFFPQGNYAFPVDSVLISTYSESFFASMGLMIALLAVLGFLFALLITLLSQVHTQYKLILTEQKEEPLQFVKSKIYSYKKLSKKEKEIEDLILAVVLGT